MLRAIALAIALIGLPAAGAGAKPAQLALHPGLEIVLSVYDGYDKSGKLLGDYDSVDTVTQVANGGYTYTFHGSGATANNGGSQTVYAEDNAHGTMLREYWPSGDDSRKGDVSYLRLSDDTYAAIKAGKETKLEMDDKENPLSIRKVGEEDLTTLVNERPTKLHTIKVQAKTTGTFWILDDPALPMMIKGITKWKWMVTAIHDQSTSGADVVAQLKKLGEATTHAILFGFNSATLDSGAKPVLDAVAQYLKTSPAVVLEIQGHTDSIGGAASNLTLSQQRAEAVKAYLVSAGVDAKRLTAKGFGLTVPVSDNKTAEGRAENRRVVFATKT